MMIVRSDKISSRKNGLIQFVKFNLVGIVNTSVDFAVFTMLTFLGVYYMAAQIISYGCGVANSFIMNKYWTFRAKSSPQGEEILKFIAVNLASLGLSLAVLYPLKPQIGVFFAKIIATLFAMIVNFLGSKFWVFKRS